MYFFDIIWWLWLVLASTLHLFIIFFLFIVHVIHQPCSSTHFSSLDVMFTFPKVKHWYLGSQKYIKDVIGEFCTDTFVISTNFSYFFKNLSSRMLFICETSFFKSFSMQLTFLMGSNILSFSLRQSSSNSCKDLESNPYLIEFISLMVAILSALSPAIQDAF
jgi:hypothetical protein